LHLSLSVDNARRVMLLWPDRCWLRSKATPQTSQRRRWRPATPRPPRRQRGAGLGSDRTRRSVGRLAGRKSP